MHIGKVTRERGVFEHYENSSGTAKKIDDAVLYSRSFIALRIKVDDVNYSWWNELFFSTSSFSFVILQQCYCKRYGEKKLLEYKKKKKMSFREVYISVLQASLIRRFGSLENEEYRRERKDTIESRLLPTDWIIVSVTMYIFLLFSMPDAFVHRNQYYAHGWLHAVSIFSFAAFCSEISKKGHITIQCDIINVSLVYT